MMKNNTKRNKCPICNGFLFVIDGKNRCENFPIKCTYQEVLENTNSNDYIVFDFETTGLNRTTDRIIQIAAVRVKDNQIVDEFNELANPGKLVSANVTKLTGITNKMLEDKGTENEIVPKFINWINEARPQYFVAHNGGFDVEFLKSACRRIGGLSMPVTSLLDTLKLARKVFPKGNKENVENHKQETLANHYSIEYDAHRADEDVKALKNVYEKLCNDAHLRDLNEMDFIEFI